MNQNKKYFVLTVIITILFASCFALIQEFRNPISYSYSFETDWEEWEKKEADIELFEGGEINRSIERSQDIAIDGNNSIKFYMNNINDAGKIWIEKNFTVIPNQNYEVHVSFYFASKDWGKINLFRIIAGAEATSPQTPEEITEIHYKLYNKYKMEATTYNGHDSDFGYELLHKNFAFSVISNENGIIFVILGIWGTWETHRTHYIDGVQIIIAKKLC